MHNLQAKKQNSYHSEYSERLQYLCHSGSLEKYYGPANSGLLRYARNDGKLVAPQSPSNLVPFHPLSLPSPSWGEGSKNVMDLSSYRLNDLTTYKRKDFTTMKKDKNVKNLFTHSLIDLFTPQITGLLRFARNDGKHLSAYTLINLSTYKRKDYTTMTKNKNVKSLLTYLPIHLFTSKKKAAFTLAEVLITLGIIGVVAAMTIPGLMSAYKAHQLHAQFLKTYSTIQQAFKQMDADDVSLDPKDYGSNDGIGFYSVFAKYVKPAKVCFRDNLVKPCYDYTSNSYKSLSGTALEYYFFDDGQIALLDGTLIMFESPFSGLTWVFADINGFGNKPDKLGYDLFVFEFKDGELRTMGDKDTAYSDTDTYCNPDAEASEYSGIACAQKAKTNSDYFKDIVKEFK